MVLLKRLTRILFLKPKQQLTNMQIIYDINKAMVVETQKVKKKKKFSIYIIRFN